MNQKTCRQTEVFTRRAPQLALWVGGLIVWSAVLATWQSGDVIAVAQSSRLAALANEEFWNLSQTLSESGKALAATYGNENLVSNEPGFQNVLPALAERHAKGDVYVGVGPEQNFTYIAALEPSAAFILDIRRENRDVLLMYKALFELAADRVSFVSLLFSRPIPPGLDREATAGEIFAAFGAVSPSDALCESTILSIKDQLLNKRKLALSSEETRGIESAFRQFRKFGPQVRYDSSEPKQKQPSEFTVPFAYDPTLPSYTDLMTSSDSSGQARSYLSSEARYQLVRSLHQRNLIIPVVGNFGGPTSLKSIGAWTRDHGLRVSTFYVSNVEGYLRRSGIWSSFCSNVAALPLTPNADFVRWDYLSQLGKLPPASAPRGAVNAKIVMEPDRDWRTWRATVRFSDGTSQEMGLEEANRLFPELPPNVNILSGIRAETANCKTDVPTRRGHD